ncbi:unnamed protein product [marine sediment metagenome]|uniref:Uncharacterized protein n=1 Tax=marine sediment metagenome TaxID=412755 RepID=X1GBB5_9ZZZZ
MAWMMWFGDRFYNDALRDKLIYVIRIVMFLEVMSSEGLGLGGMSYIPTGYSVALRCSCL